MNLIALLLLIIILSTLIFVHELGHFIAAKKTGAYVYEFAIGMGPKLFSFKRKNKNDPTLYSIRLFPIGGFCAIAGETDENDGMGIELKKDEYMCNKPIWQRCIILIAGVTMNFITGFIILFISALIWGATNNESLIGNAPKQYPASQAGIEVGDRIVKIDGKKVKTWDDITLILNMKHENSFYVFTIQKKDGKVVEYDITPDITKNEQGDETKIFGIGQAVQREKGLVPSLKYAVSKFGSIISSMVVIIKNLIVGKLPLSSLSGPVGVYTVIGEAAKTSAESVLYLAAYLSLNLGFINILPFPAFDGGRVLLLLIEAIRKKRMNPKIESAINALGLAFLMLMMAIITVKDILGLF